MNDDYDHFPLWAVLLIAFFAGAALALLAAIWLIPEPTAGF